MVTNQVTKNFNDNIAYLQAFQKGVYSKLAALDNAIENGYYQEKYELVYEKGYFDVYEKTTKKFLYAKDSSTHAKLASQSIDYELNDNLFKGFHEYIIDDSELEVYKQKKPFEDSMSGFAPIMHYCQQNSLKNKRLKTLDKFVFFGTGLGLHISSIHEKISSEVYFIIEDDLELFRLSLFTTNYAKLALDAQLIFSIFEDKSEFSKSSKEFLDTKYYYNHYIKYFHLLSHSEDKHEQFHLAIASGAHFSFDYNVLLTQNLKPLDYIFGNYKFLNKELAFADSILNEKPFLLLGAGPSLQKNIEWLRQNHKNFIIVAVSATLTLLEREHISPDIIVHLDAYHSSVELFAKIKSMDFIKNSICFFSDKIDTDVIRLFDEKNVFLFENGTNYKINSIKPSAPCVGSIAYQILLILKAKNIYLLGLDLALDTKTGKTHIDSYVDMKTISIENHTDKKEILGYSESLFKIEGNLSKEVFTNARWQTSIDVVNLSTKLLKQDSQNIFNLSDGAKFIDVNSKKVQDLELKKISRKEDIYKHLFSICLQNSSKNLNSVELNNLDEKLLHSKKLLQLVKKYKNYHQLSLAKTVENILLLNTRLTNENEIKNYQISRVIDLYLRYILGYLFDFMNSEELEKKEFHIYNLYILILEHISQIISHYLNLVTAKLKKEEECNLLSNL
ncbi:MAG: DUF115 domain-containing protein [Sulfurimonas sp.]|uniref:motility associated factor glycosyltransferase family protein n=1 Tax=Sulfurimonas sp. TaxID=2022749 RepID=UPI0026314341|nr:6-hydroxymethylpterin diphosphokinase MptE-like protein [Sulfurimonas sp.]MDD5372766.1 DUF115 domain-containing protein [Sulfurimonas sp.]